MAGVAVTVLCLQTVFSADVQEPRRQKRTGPPPGSGVISPELHPDGRATFRVYAPKASRVQLEAFDMVGKHRDLRRGDDGVWSVTVGPVRPDVYTYEFLIDGFKTIDPKNNVGQYRPSWIEVPGLEAEFLRLRDVPHGTIHQHYYRSKSIPGIRRLHVYTPPAYEAKPETEFPVLYLLHGSGETDQAWSTIGRAGIILDNLLAEKKAEPMVIVMPYGHTAPPWAKGFPFSASDGRFPQELLRDVMPFVEKEYRISQRPDSRAIAGFSMGGAQTLLVGLENLDRFSHLGVFSWGGGRDFFERKLPPVISNPESINQRVRVFWIGCGRADFLYKGPKAMHECLTELHIQHIFVESDGGHSWVNWRRYLCEFAQLLFRKT
jgi:enterochelin esterase family protein